MNEKEKGYLKTLVDDAKIELKNREEGKKEWEAYLGRLEYDYQKQSTEAAFKSKQNIEKIGELTWQIAYFEKLLKHEGDNGIKKHR
jgi:hypothetical protein